MNAQARGAMTFGSKEWNEYYHGRNKDGARAKGDKAKRAKEGLKKSLTKKGERAELEQRRAEIEAHGATKRKAEDKALGRILPDNRTHALKISMPHGNFTPADVAELERQGWAVHPAGTVPAKIGSTLPARQPVDLNPADSMARILGPELEARAVVVSSPEPLTAESVAAWQRAGYDVAPAPKKYREARAMRTNPTGAEQRRVYETLKKRHGAPCSVEDLAEAAKVPAAEALAALQRLEALGLAHPAGASLFGPMWAPGTHQAGLFEPAPALAFNPNSHYDLQNITAALAKDLEAKGWRIHGYHKDQSDSMTDYFSPAYWSGWAENTKYPGLVLVMDHPWTGNDTRPLQITPKGSLWHLERDGEILVKGQAGFSWNGNHRDGQNEAKTRKLTDRIEAMARKHAGVKFTKPAFKLTEKQEARKDRLEARAAGLHQEGMARFDKAHKMAEVIPFGQPVMGARDRNYREKIHKTQGKAFAILDQAKEVERQVYGVGRSGVASDDPEAIPKLETLLNDREVRQALMVQANKAMRAKNPAAALKEMGFNAEEIHQLQSKDFAGRTGYPAYMLQNNSGQIQRLKKRLEELKREAARPAAAPVHYAWGFIEEHPEEARIWVTFKGRAGLDTAKVLKSMGFKWSPSRTAWIRLLNNAGRDAAARFAKHLKEEPEAPEERAPEPKEKRDAASVAYQRGLFGGIQAQTAHQGRLGLNPSGQQRPRAATRTKQKAQPGSMPKPKAAKPTQKKPAIAGKAKLSKLNPKSFDGLEIVWESWTGTRAGQVLTLKVEGSAKVPARLVMLGRVTALIGSTSKIFGPKGPILATDEKQRRLFLLSERPVHLAMTAQGIAYLAKKAKFGDTSKTEYIHAFNKPVHVSMTGRTGEITGGAWKITPRGIEG